MSYSRITALETVLQRALGMGTEDGHNAGWGRRHKSNGDKVTQECPSHRGVQTILKAWILRTLG